MAQHNEIGKVGEDIACFWLNNQGHLIVDRNYREKWGEIDIVTRGTDGLVHFIEVKTVSYETREALNYALLHETWRPEENVHYYKIQRFKRAIQSWVAKEKYLGKFQIDIVTVRVVPREKFVKVKCINNVVFE